MSVKVERKELVAIAQRIYDGKLDIEKKLKLALNEKKNYFLTKLENELWRTIVRDHPWKDFTGKRESLTRANILQLMRTVIKSKFGISSTR